MGEEENWPLRLWDPVGEASPTGDPTTWDGDNQGVGTDVHGGKVTIGSDCTDRTPSVCGLLNRLLPDSGADIAADEPDRLPPAFEEAAPPGGGGAGRGG